MSQNSVTISGGITRDPDFTVTPGGYPLWKTTIAVNGTRYDSQERKQVVSTSFILINAAGYVAEQLGDLGFGKGDEILVRGELDQQSWENKETGKNEHKTRVNVLGYDVIRLKAGAQGGGQQRQQPPPPQDDPWAQPSNNEPPF